MTPAVETVVMLLGAVLVLGVLVDIWLTVLHPDVDGVVARVVQRSTWRLLARFSRTDAHRGRRVLALAGPVLVLATFLVWVLLLVLGFALVVWPNLEHYRAEPALDRPLGFVDAVYYCGITLTVLGYGDISPLTPPLKALAVLQSGIGFAVLTGVVTYIISILDGIGTRHVFALAVNDEAGEGGPAMVGTAMRDGATERLSRRLDAWAENARVAGDRIHRLPLLAFVYRSANRDYDPEPAMAEAAEAAAAALLAARDPTHTGLRPAARHLAAAVRRMQDTVATQYLHSGATDELADATGTEADHARLTAIHDRLVGIAGDRYTADPPSRADSEELRALARSRVFVEHMSGLLRSPSLPSSDDGEG